jgi:hypothetical protein
MAILNNDIFTQRMAKNFGDGKDLLFLESSADNLQTDVRTVV